MQRGLHWLWPRPEPSLADAGRNGERLIARVRFWLVACLALIPAVSLVRSPGEVGPWVGIAMSAVMLVAASVVLRLTRRVEPVPHLGFVTSAFDISAVSFFHLMVMRAGDLDMVLNSRVTFALYLLALIAAALRYDGRICVSAGILAAGQWLGLVAWSDASGLAERARLAGRFYGDTHVAGQAEEVVVLLLATALGGVIVSRARALRLSAIHDGLTRLHNRAYFEERLGEELERARRSERSLALAMIDIDHFKRVNDTWGHPVGDAVLRAVATQLQADVRRTDLVARMGGEEFAIAFPETAVTDARARLEALRMAVAGMTVGTTNANPGPITISAGLAVFPDDADSADQLIGLADQQLLSAKNAGRDRVHGTSAVRV